MQGMKKLTSVLMAMTVFVAAPVWSEIKCWTNSDGVRECGNTVPPEYSQQSHEILSEQAVVTDKTERAKTDEELAEEARLAELEKQQLREARQKALADQVLLDTFSSEQDLILARDGKIASLDAQIRLTESHIEKLQISLDQLIERAAEAERGGQTPEDDLIDQIDSTRSQIDENHRFIAAKRDEQERVRERFAADISRFNELQKQNEQAQN
jgi:hypothetical protein